MQILNDLIKFLANSPGNYVFILAISFTLIGLFQGALGSYRKAKNDATKRQLIGIGILLLFQISLFLISGLFDQEVIKQSNILPVLDRTVLLLSVIWLIWLWVFPDKSQTGDFGLILVNILAIILCIYSLIALQNSPVVDNSFNISVQALYFNIFEIVILIVGFILLLSGKKENWEIGLVFFLMIFTGILFDTFSPDGSGNYSGIIRFFLLAAFPLLFSLTSRIYSFSGPEDYKQNVDNNNLNKNKLEYNPEGEAHKKAQERKKYSADPGTLQTLFLLAAEIDISKINILLAKSIAEALLIDLCFLVYADNSSENLFISGGYDLIKQDTLEGGNIKKVNFPVISNLLENNTASLLFPNNAPLDVNGLEELLGLPNIGTTLFIPIQAEKSAVGGILLLSPYSTREWDMDDQTLLGRISDFIAPIIVKVQADKKRSLEYLQMQEKLDDQIEKSHALEILNDDLELQLIEKSEKLKEIESEVANAKVSQSSGSDKDIISVNHHEEQIDSNIGQQFDQIQRLEEELNKAREDLSTMQSKFDEISISGDREVDRSTNLRLKEQKEVIISISQELRQPMSSIIGYADLLLGESVGILGALQRKFIERIRTSTERLGSLTDDLINISVPDSKQVKNHFEATDINQVIDNVMTYTSSQMREKNIALRLDIPESLQPYFIDKEIVQQILIHLLQNAGSASPVEGSVAIRVRNEVENGKDRVIIQVSDTGGGIPETELPRLFSRFYRAENALIPGIGDKGVGLSLAKSLTESQGGSISVETEIGIGSTFSVSLPAGIEQNSPGSNGGE